MLNVIFVIIGAYSVVDLNKLKFNKKKRFPVSSLLKKSF